MALTLQASARLQPEAALGDALRAFESVLSPQQKIQLHDRSSGATPDAFAVYSLTTDLDRQNSNRRSRCVGARLVTFLESVQQFSTTLDTFVSSNPATAALVWGTVKIALLVCISLSCAMA